MLKPAGADATLPMIAKPKVRPRRRAEAALAIGDLPQLAARTDYMDSGAHAGASSLRNMRDWMPARGSPDSDLEPDRDGLVGRSRDLDRNNGIARGGIQTIVDNVVGTGLRLTPRPNYRALGWEKEQADEWSQKVFALWLGWADTTACDAADAEIFDSLTAQVFRAWLMNGEALALPLWIPGRGDDWSTKLMTIEADRLSNPEFKADDENLRAGIKFDRFGQALGYHIRTTHPGDWLSTGFIRGLGKWEYVPRKGPFGRVRVLHMFDRDRAGQSRGKPLMSSIMREFKQVDRYIAAEIDAAVVNAMIAGVITTPLSADAIEDIFSTPEGRGWYMAQREKHTVGLASGSMVGLMPGDSLTPFVPARPATAFAAFVENTLRIMAVGLDMPYELLLKDFSKTNYSSARAAMLEAWRSFNRRRDALGTKWCDPVYGLWLEEAVNSDRVEAPDFYAQRAAYTRCKWIGPGRGWVDPVKEATAAAIRINAGLSTREREVSEQGHDWREDVDQRRTERDYLAQAGFTEADAIVPGTSNDPKKQLAMLADHYATEPEERVGVNV